MTSSRHFILLESSGLMLSLLIHLFFAQYVILTFPTKPVMPKPFFLFLGSILAPEDLDFSDIRNSSSNGITQTGPALDIRSKPGRFNPKELTSPPKPLLSKPQNHENRAYLKSLFYNKEDRETQNTLDPKLGIELETPPRTPFKLYAE